MKYGRYVPSHLTTKEDLPYYSIMSPETPATFARALESGRKPVSSGTGLTASAARTVSDRPSDSRSERGVLLSSQFRSSSSTSNSDLLSVFRPSDVFLERQPLVCLALYRKSRGIRSSDFLLGDLIIRGMLVILLVEKIMVSFK
jgi:hypothetical protein